MRALSRRLPDAVLVAGVVFTLYLQTLIPAAVFAMGDAGAKFLLTRQFASGQLHADLRLPAEDWERRLWREGFFPLASPFCFRVGERYILQYPIYFPLVSAAPYRVLGWRGLYLLPLVGVWVIWIALARACRAMRVPPPASAAALFALVFASPLSYYSATFWEHIPACALFTSGFALLWCTPFGRLPGRGRAFAGSALLASAGWLREEVLVLAALLFFLGLLQRLTRWRVLAPLGSTSSLAGLLTPLVVLLAVNTALYRVPLGTHAMFFLQPTSAALVLRAGRASLHALLTQLWATFPLIALCLAAVPLLALVKHPRTRSDAGRAALLLVCAVVLTTTVPFLVRNAGGRQWGPRYLLPVVPLLCLVVALALAAASRRGGGWRWAAWLTFGVLAAAGAHTNTWQAAATLRHNYQGRLVPYRFVQQSGFRYVAVAQDMVAQQLADAFDGRTFFLAPRGKDLRRLAAELALHGESRFLYLCYAHYGCGPLNKQKPPYPARLSLVAPDGRVQVELINRGMVDRYAAFEAVVLPMDAGGTAPGGQKRGGRQVTVRPP